MKEPVEEDDLDFSNDDVLGYPLEFNHFPTGKEIVDGFIISMAIAANTSEDNVAKELVRTTGITIPRFIELANDYKWDGYTIWTVWVNSHNPKIKAEMSELFGKRGFRVSKRTFFMLTNLRNSTPPLFDSNTISSLWEQEPQREQKPQPSSNKNWFQKLFGL